MSFLCGKFKEKTKTKIQTLIISDFCTVTSYKLKKKTLELLQAHLCDLILSFNFFILITLQNITNHFYARLTVILKTRFCFVYAGFWERNSWLQIAPNIWLGKFFYSSCPYWCKTQGICFAASQTCAPLHYSNAHSRYVSSMGCFLLLFLRFIFCIFPILYNVEGWTEKQEEDGGMTCSKRHSSQWAIAAPFL